MKLYRTAAALVLEQDGRFHSNPQGTLDNLLVRDDLGQHLAKTISDWKPADESALKDLRAPIAGQEVWAAGVTYYRSRTARMAESTGGGSFYDRVYDADRPELFFKAT